jgi:hypothetical protein
MQLQSFQYISDKGWTVKNFPALDSPQTLVLIFAAPEFFKHSAPIKELTQFYKNAKIIGCSSAGEISGANILDKSISVAVAKFTNTPLKLSAVKIKSTEESFQAGKELANELNKDDLRSIFILSDGLKINGSELVKGLNTINKKDVIITGGLAGDGSHFKQTWTVINGDIITDSIVAVGFYGNHVHVGHGSRGGWDIFGPERRITKSKNNILYELDNKPALSLYKEYLGDKAAGLPATGLLFPLAIRKDVNDKHQLVRTILAVDEKNQSLTFAGDVPTGYLAQLMRANFDRLIDGASEAGRLALASEPEVAKFSPMLLIAVSCVGRRLLLGERTEEETETTLELFPEGTQQVGFYSYGELSPFAHGNCDLHNQTMTLTSICEDT